MNEITPNPTDRDCAPMKIKKMVPVKKKLKTSAPMKIKKMVPVKKKLKTSPVTSKKYYA